MKLSCRFHVSTSSVPSGSAWAYLLCVLCVALQVGCGIKSDGLAAPPPSDGVPGTNPGGADGGGAVDSGAGRIDAAGGQGSVADAASGSTTDADAAAGAASDRKMSTTDASMRERDVPAAASDTASGLDTAPVRQDAPDHPPRAQLVISTNVPQPGDVALQARLSALGFQVSVAVAATAQALRTARQQSLLHDLVVVSSSYNAGAVDAAPLSDLPVPILCMEPQAFSRLGMVEDRNDTWGLEANRNALIITMPGHAMAAKRPAGQLTVLMGSNAMSWARPVASAIVVATTDRNRSDQATIFAYEAGAALAQGTAAARRVGFFLQEPSVSNLNDAGLALLDAAVKWAAPIIGP